MLTSHPRTSWNPYEDLKTLKQRTWKTTSEMIQNSEIIPPLIRIEHDHWVFEKLDPRAFSDLKHKLIVHDEHQGKITLGVTFDMDTALHVASKMAEIDQKIVSVETM